MQDNQQPNNPGWVFKPGDEHTPQPDLPSVQSQPVQEATAIPQPTAPLPAQGPATVMSSDMQHEGAHITWTASEYIANPKNTGWFALLAASSLVLAVVVYLLTKDIVSTVVIVVLGVLVGTFAARQPRTLQYEIDDKGVHIGGKLYPYAGFKAFSLADEHATRFISLLPLRRFMPPLVVHYAAEDEQTIADVLASYLPYEEHKTDIVDSITRRVRF